MRSRNSSETIRNYVDDWLQGQSYPLPHRNLYLNFRFSPPSPPLSPKQDFFEANLCGKIDAFLSGHDHCLQWLKPVPRCSSNMSFIVSGAGAKMEKVTVCAEGYAYAHMLCVEVLYVLTCIVYWW